MSVELIKEGIRKCGILPLVLTIILVLAVPVGTLVQKSEIDESAKTFQQLDSTAANLDEPVSLDMEGSYKEMATANIIYTPYVMVIILILPIVLGVQLFGHSAKNKNRLADFINEKGLTKEIVYRTNMFTGMLLSIIPILVTAVILIIIKLFAGMGDYIATKAIVDWTCAGVFLSLVFFTVTVLFAYITKNRVLQVLYTYGILIIPVYMIYLFEVFLTKVIYGFPGFTTRISELITQLPTVKIAGIFIGNYATYISSAALNLWYVLAYIVIIGLIVFICKKFVNIENKEKINKIGDKIFKYIWILLLGMLLYISFMVCYGNPLVSIVTTVALFLIVYVLKEVITKKSIKAILNGKRYYILSVIIVLGVILLSSDLFGYERRIPDIEDVEYMTYTASYPNKSGEIEFREENNIKELIEKHKNFILEKNEIKDITSEDFTKVYIQYKLKNGKYIVRSYDTILTTEGQLLETQEYVEQKYDYMYGNSENIDMLRIAGLYNGKTFVFDVNRYEHLDLLNEVVNCISNDLTNYDVHLPANGEYMQYSEKEGIQLLQIAILDGMNQYTNYLYYLKIDPEYDLVKKLQTLIDEESEFITWYEDSDNQTATE